MKFFGILSNTISTFLNVTIEYLPYLTIEMDIEYVDIMTGENFRKFRVLQWSSYIGQLVHPLGGKGWVKGVGLRVPLIWPSVNTLLHYLNT